MIKSVYSFVKVFMQEVYFNTSPLPRHLGNSKPLATSYMGSNLRIYAEVVTRVARSLKALWIAH
jgi:hypothetical protein